ncbi:hypothetical protein [Histidinibacterium aquaticum]|uniref:Sugar transporter n=1 Tax=Histidinibacterium aquaticum TaxID=2613962 RepID=A0A5J5GL98_9RHOB|nr:hypothetical protein [Histidinibacterium aquaticum]KAA9008262.1 hypothetical protein F3S47_12295 [Histidinibacterium aquaticum]
MKTPWHVWVVGGVSLLWNSGGAIDYLMLRFRVEAYTGQLTEAQLGFFESLPVWASIGWALGVWGAWIGSVLLLLRSRFAGTAFALSLLGIGVNSIYTYGLAGAEVDAGMGAVQAWFAVAIVVITAGLLFYARAMARRGVLR